MSVVSDLPRSAADAVPPDNTSQWLRNLDVDFETSNVVPSTLSSIRTDPVSTPALPSGVEESEGTATPQRFEPDNDDGSQTVSDETYNHIRKSRILTVKISLLFYFSKKSLSNGT